MAAQNADHDRASDGGGDAPPAAGESNSAPADLTRVYDNERIVVEWYASRCIHSAACIRAAPRVFDPRRRPWIAIDASDPETVADAVMRCPTGALAFRWRDGTPQPSASEIPRLAATSNGPYYVRGTVEVVDEAGNVLCRDSRFALCRCGKSRKMPFCDNTHREIGFRSDSNPLET